MKVKIVSIVVLFSAISLLSSCSTNDKKDRLADAKAAQDEMKLKNKAIEEKLDALPSWVLTPPKPDSQAVYAVGIGDSDSLQVSMKKAMLEAEFGLAKQLKQELSGSERQYTADDSIHATNRFEGLIDKLVQETPVVGYTVKKQVVKPMDGKYQTFVLLMLPYDQYNEALKSSQAKETRQEMKEAFADLERRLDKKKLEKGLVKESQLNNEQLSGGEEKHQ